jgi:hypothetical protein
MSTSPDACTFAGATALANQISDYWRKRGLAGVRVWVESVPIMNSNVTQFKGGKTYQIKSNISQLIQPKKRLDNAITFANK